MSQKPATQPAARQSTLATFSPPIPRPEPWTRDGSWILNHEHRPVCMLLPNTTDAPKKLLLAAGDTAWQRDVMLACLRDVATAPGLEGVAVDSARALLAEMDKDAT